MKRILAPSLVVALSAVLLIQLPWAIAAKSDAIEFFEPLFAVRSILADRFAEPVDDEAMQRAAIDAMIDTLGDPYTVYVPAKLEAEFDKNLRGTYVGIGAEVNVIDGFLTIISPMPDSPALEAGIRAGDIVLEIGGISTLDKSVDENIEVLLGEPGTDVDVLVRHVDGQEELLTITRRRIITETVRGIRRDGEGWSYCIDPEMGIGYLRLSQFNDTSAIDIRRALDELEADAFNGLIFDLRDNPGGGLGTAIQVSDLFLDSGEIVSVRGRSEPNRTFSAEAGNEAPDVPMIILINGQSASASEIVSGALQDNGRARVLGTRTFGKGSVQEVRDLKFNVGTLKYTAAHYYRPSGRNINRMPDSEVWGVDPDPGFVVPVTDEQYIDMLRARREFEIINDANLDVDRCADPAWIASDLKDSQLSFALEALQTKLDGGDWPVFGNEDPALVALDGELERAIARRARLLRELDALNDSIERRESLAEAVGREPLLPPDTDLIAGHIELRDREGNVVGTYKIEGGDVESALESIRLTPIEEADDTIQR